MVSIMVMQVADIDEIERELVGDEVHLRLKTASPLKSFARLKARLKTLVTFPIKVWKIKDVETAERGIWRTFHIEMVLPKKVDRGSPEATLRNLFRGGASIVSGNGKMEFFDVGLRG